MDRTRASDTERERVAVLLSEAAAAGRLTVDELEQRTEAAYAAVTRGELSALLDDLPAGARRPQPPVPVHAPAPMPAHRRSPPPGYLPPLGPTESRWPGPRPWMPGDLRFWVRWHGPSDTRLAGTHIMQNIVPIFRDAGFEIADRAADRLVLRRRVSELTRMFNLGVGAEPDTVTIAMFDRHQYSVTDIYGVAPQRVRELLARIVR